MVIQATILVLATCGTIKSGTIDSHDPNLTATIVLHGFDPDGASHEGVFGADLLDDPLIAQVAEVALLPANDGSASLPTNVVATTSYYGSTPPSYYTAQDIAELNAVTKQYGGGIPRYALIIAKYANHIMDRSGAQQVNLVSASMGSFVARWMIEKDSDDLASSGIIARWLSLEGVLCGNWVASNESIADLWDQFGTPTIDVEQMHYNWVEENVHSPRTEADNPLYGDILIGMEMSSRDTAGGGNLSTFMLLEDDFHANDGVVTIDDSHFAMMSPQSKFQGLGTTQSWMHVNHYELKEYEPAMVQIANFLTRSRRVVVKVIRLQVTNTEEPDDFWWDWTPAEIVIESDVYSPRAEKIWGITESFCTRGVEGVSSPIYEFDGDGDELYLNHILFDEFITNGESSLEIQLGAFEIDWSEKYDIFEPLDGDGNDLGSMMVSIPIGNEGTVTQEFAHSNFNGTIEIQVIDYPFATLEEEVAGDVNGDGNVNVSDVLAVISAWGSCEGCIEDLDNSGSVDVTDLLIVIGNWT